MSLVMLLLFVALFVGLFALGTGWFQTGEGRVLRERLVALAQAAQRGPREDLALLGDELLSAIPAFNRLLSAPLAFPVCNDTSCRPMFRCDRASSCL